MVSASFVSRRAKFSVYLASNIKHVVQQSFENVSSPFEINFNHLSEITAESYYFPRPAYAKLIHRPERTFQAHIHRQNEADTIPNSTLRYKHVKPSNTRGYILHLRRVIGNNFKLHIFQSTDILKDQARVWQHNLSTRLKGYKFPLSQWPNKGLEVLRTIESCRNGHENRRTKECHSVHDCAKDLNTTGWFYSPNSWIVLY